LRRNSVVRIAVISSYAIFVALSWTFGFDPGREVSHNFASFSLDMLRVLPCAFILIGLFEIWVKKETVEKYLGDRSGLKAYLWGVLLASTTVGGLYVAFPVAYSLYGKGAKLGVIFTYIGASAICRVPMTIFEASFLGIKFTAVRLLVAVPLVVVTSKLLGDYLQRRKYRIVEGDNLLRKGK